MGLRELLETARLSLKESERQGATEQFHARLGETYLGFTDRWSENQRVVLASKKPFLFAIGGNGAGKTTLGSWWVKSELDSFNPITGEWKERRHPVNVYCVANTQEKMVGVMQPALRRWLPKNTLVHEDRQNNIWHLTEERKVLWKTGEQDSTTFTGDEIDAAWVDEELKRRSHWDEILARLARRLGRVLNTFTAAEGILWMNHWIFSPDEYPMEEKEIRRIPTDDNPYYHDCDRCGCPKAWHEKRERGACEAFDNSQGQAKLDRWKRQFRGIVYKIRVEGHALLLAGKPVFSPEVREKKEKEHSRAPIIGWLNEQVHFVPCEDEQDEEARGWLRLQIGKDARTGKPCLLSPLPDHKYVIGVDVGGGNPTGDYHAAVVIDEETGEQCALAHTRDVEPRDFGAFVCQLARFYNDAYCVVEFNNHGIAVIDRLVELNYGNVYRRQRLDAMTKLPTLKAGFWTNSKTKFQAVDLMQALFYENRLKIHDPIIYAEAFHYTWLKEDRPGCFKVGNSNPGGHDDTMTALFCACTGLKQMGWLLVGAKDEVQVEWKKSIGDTLFEDSIGRALGEDEILEGLSDSALQESVEDAADDPFSDEPFIP